MGLGDDDACPYKTMRLLIPGVGRSCCDGLIIRALSLLYGAIFDDGGCGCLDIFCNPAWSRTPYTTTTV